MDTKYQTRIMLFQVNKASLMGTGDDDLKEKRKQAEELAKTIDQGFDIISAVGESGYIVYVLRKEV